ncbi:MAG: peptidoglycan DD-metalloendopeptidase family protein [Nocardioides sp.]
MSAKNKFVAATGIVLALGVVAMMVPVLLLAVLGGGGAAGCAPAAQVTYTGPGVGDLTTIQMQRAAAVVSQGRQMGIPDQGIIIALATASQESGFRVYANDGKGGDLAADQKGIEASLNRPHDAVGTDHGSLGVFQQQWPWWGNLAELMDPAISARKFYEALLKIEGWQNLPVTVAAQRVQRSAYPDAYADDEPLARDLLAAIGGSSSNADTGGRGGDEQVNASGGAGELEIKLVNGVYVGGFTDCLMPTAAVGGAVVLPLPSGSGYVNQNNFGQAGSSWDSFHTGNDYSVACGTPVLAVTGGIVEFDDAQAGWAGPSFVRISTGGPGTLATWYAHMQTRSVSDGQTVSPGQPIGTVGNMGNSRGCHLHFEVHPKGGRIYDDPVDPVAWFAANLGKDDLTASASSSTSARKVARANAPGRTVAASPGGTDTLTVLSYNIKRGMIAKNKGDGLAALAQEITSSGAMVVALQEADNLSGRDFGAVVQDLARQMRMQFAYAVTGTWTGREIIDNAILSKYPIVRADNTNLPGGAGIQPRGLLKVTVDLGDSAGLVDVYGSHLHYTGNVRVTQAAKIRSEVGTPDCATVLMGDMNSTPGSEPHAELTATMRDAFSGGRFGPGNTSPVGTPKNRIDYVFHDPGTSVVDAMVMPAGQSDHRAVRATLQLTSDGYC